MIHTYKITGMTCAGCLATVKQLLLNLKNVQAVDISLAEGTAEISMGKHIATADLQLAFKDYPKYQLYPVSSEIQYGNKEHAEKISWVKTYKPILLIFAYISAITLIASFKGGVFNVSNAMRIFMSGFFLVFSFFKLLDLQGFAESYAMYDLLAKRWKNWGYIYAFIELALGILFALNLFPVIVNIATLFVMAISLAGVLQSVFNKQQIKCACLGSVFNLPMSTITIVEDGLMIVMSLFVLIGIS